MEKCTGYRETVRRDVDDAQSILGRESLGQGQHRRDNCHSLYCESIEFATTGFIRCHTIDPPETKGGGYGQMLPFGAQDLWTTGLNRHVGQQDSSPMTDRRPIVPLLPGFWLLLPIPGSPLSGTLRYFALRPKQNIVCI